MGESDRGVAMGESGGGEVMGEKRGSRNKVVTMGAR